MSKMSYNTESELPPDIAGEELSRLRALENSSADRFPQVSEYLGRELERACVIQDDGGKSVVRMGSRRHGHGRSRFTSLRDQMIADGLKITAIHNHLVGSSPETFYMHIAGSGDPVKLATSIREARLSQRQLDSRAADARLCLDRKAE